MRRTDRLFELIQMFRDGRTHRGQELADALGVSVRTVYRDVETLVASGIPVEGARGVGYILRAPIFLPPLSLTVEELAALQFAVTLARRAGDGGMAEAAGRLMAKIDAVLPDGRRRRTYLGAVEVYASAPDLPARHLSEIGVAVTGRELLALSYESLKGARTQRTIRPLRLEFWGHVWTLTAWCEMRDGFRVFRVDRIRTLDRCGTFRPEPGRTYEDYLLTVAETPHPAGKPGSRRV